MFNDKKLAEAIGLEKGERIKSVKRIKCQDESRQRKQVTYYCLVTLHWLGLLPKGYLTKVDNGHIGYDSAYKMAINKYKQIKGYDLKFTLKDGVNYIAFIEKKKA